MENEEGGGALAEMVKGEKNRKRERREDMVGRSMLALYGWRNDKDGC